MIINSYSQYNILKSRMDLEQHVCTPIFRDLYTHPSVNAMLCVGITFFNGDSYTVSISHRDAMEFDLPMGESTCFVINVKDLPENDLYEDISLMAYITNNRPPQLDDAVPNLTDFFTTYMKETRHLFGHRPDTNKIIPLSIWGLILRNYNIRLIEFLSRHRPPSLLQSNSPYAFLRSALTTLRQIERAGMAVDTPTFKDHFGEKVDRYITNDIVYTKYNIYTTTGRASNSFGGINFLALNKKDGSRSAFISRFHGGQLLQLDFEAYHLRLIAAYAQFTLPTTSLHKYLATQYYEKDDISPEEYDLSKQITFKVLYGEAVDTDIPMLSAIKKVSSLIYQEYKQNGFIITPMGNRKIFVDDNPAEERKIFNYFIQAFEFEHTISKLTKLVDFMESLQSKVILYTYDAILIDCHPSELDQIQAISHDIMSTDEFPVRQYIGTNYGNLTVV